MYTKISKEKKKGIIQRYFSGESVAVISRETQIPRSTLYLWIRQTRAAPTRKARIKDFSRLQKMHERLQRVI